MIKVNDVPWFITCTDMGGMEDELEELFRRQNLKEMFPEYTKHEFRVTHMNTCFMGYDGEGINKYPKALVVIQYDVYAE